jgi:hypothetical protein
MEQEVNATQETLYTLFLVVHGFAFFGWTNGNTSGPELLHANLRPTIGVKETGTRFAFVEVVVFFTGV